jgi:Mn2+/Fe2+ NRAMP family transporter
MMLIINKPEIMGEYTNKRYQNIIGWTTSIVLIILSAVLLLSGIS